MLLAVVRKSKIHKVGLESSLCHTRSENTVAPFARIHFLKAQYQRNWALVLPDIWGAEFRTLTLCVDSIVLERIDSRQKLRARNRERFDLDKNHTNKRTGKMETYFSIKVRWATQYSLQIRS